MTSSLALSSALRAVALCVAGLLVGCTTTPRPMSLSCKSPLSSNIKNSCVVSERMLWRGARPDRIGATTLMELGVKTVVNLELIHDDLKEFEAASVSLESTQEIQYFRVRDWEPIVVLAPAELDEHVAHFLAIVRTQPTPIFVHCRSGQNRTGVMVAAFRVFSGADIEKAIREMGTYGGIWFEYDAAYIRSLTPERRANLEKRITAWIPRLQRSALILCSKGKCTANAS